MTPERRQVIDLLTELSSLNPDMRLGQWLGLFASLARGPELESIYDVEDQELIPAMRNFLQERRAADSAPVFAN